MRIDIKYCCDFISNVTDTSLWRLYNEPHGTFFNLYINMIRFIII